MRNTQKYSLRNHRFSVLIILNHRLAVLTKLNQRKKYKLALLLSGFRLLELFFDCGIITHDLCLEIKKRERHQWQRCQTRRLPYDKSLVRPERLHLVQTSHFDKINRCFKFIVVSIIAKNLYYQVSISQLHDEPTRAHHLCHQNTSLQW